MQTSPTGTQELLEVLRHRYTEVAEGDAVALDEPSLAAGLGISRAKLREALARLEEEGLGTRRRGVGFILNPEAALIGSRFDRQTDYENTLRESGFEPSVQLLRAELKSMDAEAADRFGHPVGTEMVETRKLWRAGTRPAMTALDQIPAPGITDLGGIDLTRPVFDLTVLLAGDRARWEVVRPGATSISAELAPTLEVEPGDAVLSFELLGISERGRRLYHAAEHHVPGLIDYGLIRPIHQ